jgi:hypothetical protein
VHTADQYIENAVDLPSIHIVDPTAHQLIARGFSTVGLLGSRYTMTGDYFVGRLQKQYGLRVLVAKSEHHVPANATTDAANTNDHEVRLQYSFSAACRAGQVAPDVINNVIRIG